MERETKIFPLDQRLRFIFDMKTNFPESFILSTERPCLENLLQLSFDFATHLLQATDKEYLLATVLVAVTAGEGLGFNRAFFLEKSPHKEELRGVLGIGPPSREEAVKIWESIRLERPSFQEMVNRVRGEIKTGSSPLKRLSESLYIDLSFGHSITRAIKVQKAVLLKIGEEARLSEIFRKLGVEEIAAVPLSVPPTLYGLLLVDNFVNRRPIIKVNLQFLEIMATLTSLALARLNIYKELEEEKDLLIEAERLSALGQLASKVFHEIRNPVSALGGLSRLLLRKDIPKDIKLYLETIIQEAERLERVLEDLFEFIRPIRLAPKPTGLYQLLQTVLTLLSGDFRESRVHLVIEVADREPIVYVDQEEIQLALIHILKNALEAMPEGGILRIGIDLKDGVEIAISDSGLGIPRAYLNRVTEPFFTTKIYGSGLGLSVAKRIVELHKGSISIERIEPSGTKVVIKLPSEVLCNGEDK